MSLGIPARKDLRDGVFRHAELGISYRPPEGFHVGPNNIGVVSFRNRVEPPTAVINLDYYPDTDTGRAVLIRNSYLQAAEWRVVDQEVIPQPGGGHYRESVRRLPATGLFVRKCEFWLPAKPGFVHFEALLLEGRPELRDAILQSVGTLVV